MKKYSEMTKDEILSEKASLLERYEEIKSKGLKLNISRGTPCPEQLALSHPMLDVVNSSTENFCCESGADVRNYGVIDGIPEARKLFGDYLGVPAENVIVTGNSTLNLFYDLLSHAMMHGVPGGNGPWSECKNRKILCPTPGYDRHFAAAEFFGFELVPVKMSSDGPDMDAVEELVKDPSVRCIICVPKYSNPQGITYSDETIERFAKLTPAAKDFRIYWDNAYNVHELYPDSAHDLPSLLPMAEENGNGDMVYMFASTSKITFPTAGLSVVAASENNIKDLKHMFSLQNIGPDKINQLRHVLFFKDFDGIKEHMKKHAEILRPKFEGMLKVFDEELAPTGTAKWEKPRGGYFIAAELMPGTAKRTVALCKDAGLTLTAAGSVFPHGVDPEDSVLRIAPSYAPLSDIPVAAELFCISAKIAACEILEK